jgi:hypothetical protein
MRVRPLRRSVPVLSGLLGLGILTSACGGGSHSSTEAAQPSAPADVLADLQVVPTPKGGMAFYTPIIKALQPGSDVTYCTYTDVTAPDDLFVHTTRGTESKYGHHVILYYTTADEAPRTEICGGQSMENLQQILGGSGGEGASVWDPPANVGMTVPKGARFVLQSHWIHTGNTPTDVQAMMVTEPGIDGPDRIETGTVAIVNLSFSVPAMAQAQSSTECTFDTDHKLIMSIGHEHEWGVHVRADLTRADGTAQVIFDRPFAPSDVFDPPINGYGVDQPLLLAKGDKLKMSCEWQNTTNAALTFPREMCVFFGYSMEHGDARCINGAWIGAQTGPADAGPALSGPPCVAQGAPGNDQGVGKYCSAAGGQCSANGAATICLADYVSGGFGDFCTRLCATDGDCGAGAVCKGSGSGPSACIPASCAGSPDGGAP